MKCAEELNCNNMLIITWNQDMVIEKEGKKSPSSPSTSGVRSTPAKLLY